MTPSARSCWPGSCGHAIRTIPISSKWKPTSTTSTARIRRPACRSGAAWPTPRRRIAWRTRTRRRRGRDWERRCSWIASARPISPSSSCGRCWPRRRPRRWARRRVPAWPWGGDSTAWAHAPRPLPNTGWHWRRCLPATRSSSAPEARDGLRRGPDPVTAEAYRLSLEGWRALERGALAEASRALGRALALRPADPATRYRHARLQLAERHIAEGVSALEAVISDPATPPHVFAGACYHAARALEQQGVGAPRDRALSPRGRRIRRRPGAQGRRAASAPASVGVSSVDVERALSGIGERERVKTARASADT